MTTTKHRFLIGAMAMLIALTCLFAAKPQEAQAATTTDTVAVVGTYDYTKANAVLTEVNKQRSKAGVSKLTMDQTLTEEAMKRAAELSVYYDTKHTRPDGSSWNTEYSHLGSYSGENYGMGYSNALAAVNSWMSSSRQKKDMLDSRYTATGIGCFTNNGVTYWVQVYSNSSAKGDMKSGSKDVRVVMNVSPDKQKSLTLSSSSRQLKVGESTIVNAYLKNRGNAKSTSALDASRLTWSSSNPSVASVSSSGEVTAKSAGNVKITAKTSKGTISASTTIKVIAPSTSISKCTITLSQTLYTYDGKAKKPSVSVKYGSQSLRPGVDYTVSYSNNVNAGTGRVTIKGKGNYTGSVTKSFTIKKMATSLSQCSVSLSQTDYTYDGNAKKPKVTVKYGSKTLKSGTDYTVSYTNNVNVGTGRVTITGKGSYAGRVLKTFTIKNARTSLSQCTVSLSQTSYTYDGKAKTPMVTVKYGSKTLRSGTDYTVSYKNNINSGTASVVVSGKGNYSGTKTVSFKINSKPSSGVSSSESTAKQSEEVIDEQQETTTDEQQETTTDETVTVEAAEISSADRKANPAPITEKDPFGLQVKSDIQGTLTVFFSSVSGASGYEVMYSEDANFSEEASHHTGMVKVKGSSSTEFRLAGLSQGKTYYVKVRSYTDAANGNITRSEWGSTVSVKIMK